jgi:hypothetical protein
MLFGFPTGFNKRFRLAWAEWRCGTRAGDAAAYSRMFDSLGLSDADSKVIAGKVELMVTVRLPGNPADLDSNVIPVDSYSIISRFAVGVPKV